MIVDPTRFQQLLELLELESEAEKQQLVERTRRLSTSEAESTGLSLVDLVVRDGFAGLGGHFILTLSKRNQQSRLPWTRLNSGTPIVLSGQGANPSDGWRGIVTERGASFIRVAFSEPPDEDESGTVYRLDAASDETARIRQREALKRAAIAKKNRFAELRDVVQGLRGPEFEEHKELSFLDASLNDSQKRAVQFALSARDVAVLRGPPGTGKTTTIVEIVRQAVRRGWRVLVCAPSNLAVDNVLERLIAHKEKAIRLGHPARVTPELRDRTLDLLVEQHEDSKLARKLVKEARAAFRQAGKWTRGKPQPGSRQSMREDARSKLADARRLEKHAIDSVLYHASIVCSTLTGFDDDYFTHLRFDLLVIDEACQSTEPACWIPLPFVERVILAGDHCQLPPTVISGEALRRGFGISLLERLLDDLGMEISRQLDVQYRMHTSIMKFSSVEFYQDTLIAAEGVGNRLLCDLPEVAPSALCSTAVTFIDTAGAGFDEVLEPDGESRLNPQEANLAVKKVRQLLGSGVAAKDVAVIAPYSAQVRYLRGLLSDVPDVDVDSVDGFQGREKEAIILTLVRSNLEGELGFLRDVRRTNVAMTRARRCLIIIGDSATLSHHPFYARAIEYFGSIEAHHVVWEEMDE